MKKLHTLAFYALITPIITLGATSLLAQPTAGAAAGQQPDREQTTTPRAPASQGAQNQGQAGQSQSQAAQSQGQSAQNQGQAAQNQRAQTAQGQAGMAHTGMAHKGFISAVPAKGMHSSQLIGAEVKNSADENLGDVSELVINEHGQIVAIVVGVGGFLGMGERDVAFGWDDVTKVSNADGEAELTVNLTRENLRAAPEFKMER